MPMAMPPVIRQVMKDGKLCDQPVRTEDTAKRMAERMRSFLRPKRSLIAPERIELKEFFVERLSAADHNPVIAENETSQRSDCANRPHISSVVVGWSFRSR